MGARSRRRSNGIRASKLPRAEQRANYEVMPMGIHWPDVDDDLGIAAMPKGRT